jgi:hypothetical protein
LREGEDDPSRAAAESALRGLTDEDVSALLGGLHVDAELHATSEDERIDEPGSAAPEAPILRRFVPTREVDELRAILRRVESRGTLRKELARKVGLPLARVTLLLIGHVVPIPTRAAEKIRALNA